MFSKRLNNVAPCRYYFICSRPDCTFAHASPCAPHGTIPTAAPPCKFDLDCKNPGCFRAHSSPAKAQQVQPQQVQQFQPQQVQQFQPQQIEQVQPQQVQQIEQVQSQQVEQVQQIEQVQQVEQVQQIEQVQPQQIEQVNPAQSTCKLNSLMQSECITEDFIDAIFQCFKDYYISMEYECEVEDAVEIFLDHFIPSEIHPIPFGSSVDREKDLIRTLIFSELESDGPNE